MRTLASIQRIWDVQPIEGADRIELVQVCGWKCVANKGQFQKGDLGVYFEIDSFLPVRPEFEFLRTSCYKNTNIMGEGFLLRTRTFKGQISQGLVLPLSAFSEIPAEADIGMDVTELLGVKKWEIEERATTGGTVIGKLPSCVPHTDETRIQSNPDLLEEFRNREYYISTKMDGSSHSLCIDKDGFHVCGHNYEYRDDDSNSFYKFVKKKNYREWMEKFYNTQNLESLVVQGEFCAPGIQKNRLKLAQPEWFVFTIMVNGSRVDLNTMLTMAAIFDMPTVPIEEQDFNLPAKYPTVDALLARADGDYPNGGKKEGIVIRTVEPVYSPTIGGPLSIKVVNNKYLLKNGE